MSCLWAGERIFKKLTTYNNCGEFKYTDSKINYWFKFEVCVFSALPISYNTYIFYVLVGSTCFLSGYLSVKDIKNVDS